MLTEDALNALIGLEMHYGNANVMKEPLQIAIAALREKVESDKGCIYCTDRIHILHACLNESDDAIRVFVDGDKLTIRGDGWEETAKIHNCPNCGRKLKEARL